MSFDVEFNARSRSHALRLLTEHAKALPAPVLSLLKTAIENLPTPKDATRIIQVHAAGHICDGPSSSTTSQLTITVMPIEIPD